MFENMQYETLQQYWFFIIALLGALLVFLLFVQGGQMLIYTLGKTPKERTILVNLFGRKWEFTFSTLVTFGGAFFASFPLFYSTSFGGAYWVWMIILLAFVIQAVSYEYRSKPNNFFGAKVFEVFLWINGFVATLFLGTAVATFFTGSPFHINNMNNSFWDSPFHGLELALQLFRYEVWVNLSLGLGVFFLSKVLAVLYIMNSVEDDAIISRIPKSLLINAVGFLVFFLFFLANVLLMPGYAIDPNTQMVSLVDYKYFHNLLEMPINTAFFLLGVVLVLWGIGTAYIKKANNAIWFAGIGTVLTVLTLFLLAGFNHTAYYPSYTNLQSSLTIYNSSSSEYTLIAMSYVSLLVPFVLAYIWYAWKAINGSKISQKELDEESHVY
jgi:cytochrome d ubiquinol oxidase subunit II